jgi:ubiquinone biosynthesis protein COQ4
MGHGRTFAPRPDVGKPGWRQLSHWPASKYRRIQLSQRRPDMDTAYRYPERDLWAAARDAAVWLSGPVSERGAARASRMALHMGGRTVHERRLAMREHPVGSNLLDERPDLCAALNDMPALAAMPEGSLGRTYHSFMDHPETIPGYLLSGLIYRDNWFDTVPMDDELRWAFERWMQTHDLMHVVSGYGADLAGEGLNIYFTGGYNLGFSWRATFWSPFGLAPRLMRPSISRESWHGYLREAWARGAAARRTFAFESVPWEELLPRPLEEARRTLGLPPLADPALDSSGWTDDSFFTRNFLASNVDYESVKGVKAAVEAGVRVKDLMSANADVRSEVERLARDGSSLDDLHDVLLV